MFFSLLNQLALVVGYIVIGLSLVIFLTVQICKLFGMQIAFGFRSYSDEEDNEGEES